MTEAVHFSNGRADAVLGSHLSDSIPTAKEARRAFLFSLLLLFLRLEKTARDLNKQAPPPLRVCSHAETYNTYKVFRQASTSRLHGRTQLVVGQRSRVWFGR